MTIHGSDRFLAGAWDWTVLDGCFGNTQIRPTDVDGMIERDLRPRPILGSDYMGATTIQGFGMVNPPTARSEDKTVIGGHQGLPAARRLGLMTAPVTSSTSRPRRPAS